MTITATIIWITITNFSVVNDKQLHSFQNSYPTPYTYAECQDNIKERASIYSKERREDRDNYSYSYNTIKCEKKPVKKIDSLLNFVKLN